jgi:hypothetical protein
MQAKTGNVTASMTATYATVTELIAKTENVGHTFLFNSIG